MKEPWTALPKKDLMMELFMAEQNLNSQQETYWNKIRLSPEIWKCIDVIEDYFWVVAQTNKYVVWYNDIEESFNLSSYQIAGEIREYHASKQELNNVLEKLLYLENKKT